MIKQINRKNNKFIYEIGDLLLPTTTSAANKRGCCIVLEHVSSKDGWPNYRLFAQNEEREICLRTWVVNSFFQRVSDQQKPFKT